MDYDLRICSKGELESHFFKREKDPDYILGIYTGLNLNLNCLKEQFQKKVQNYPKEYLNDSSIKVSHDISYYKSYITNYDRVICGESCYLDEDSILFVDDKFWYIYDLYNSYGHKANFVQTLDNKIHIELNEVTHTKNILFDTKQNTFSYLYDGKLNFHEDYYIAKYTKNYFKNGGAFWYSAIRDYNNNIIHRGYCEKIENPRRTLHMGFHSASRKPTWHFYLLNPDTVKEEDIQRLDPTLKNMMSEYIDCYKKFPEMAATWQAGWDGNP